MLALTFLAGCANQGNERTQSAAPPHAAAQTPASPAAAQPPAAPAAAAAAPRGPSGPPGTEAGFATFQTQCTTCHGNPAVERAPSPSAIREMSPEKIYAALTTGVM
jgi:mono/diheme cytochrome c family protein